MSDSTGLTVGERVSDFSGRLVDPDGTERSVSLSELLEGKPVLLNFYTADFSPDCIDEWCSFRDFDWFATGDQVQVVGVSKSGAALHRRFIEYLDLGFPLFTDPDLDIAAVFDVRYRAFKIASRAHRSTFLVDCDRRVRYRWLADHWLDPSRDTPPVREIYDAVVEKLEDELDTYEMG